MNGDPRLVSLIMPVWQPRRAWLQMAVSTALGQRDCRIELIVVDDGCSVPVVEHLAGIDDPRLRVTRVEHGGVSRARNIGMAAASGRWLRFIDCDDVFPPDGTGHLLRLTKGDEEVIAYGGTVICDEFMRPRSAIESRLHGSIVVPCLLRPTLRTSSTTLRGKSIDGKQTLKRSSLSTPRLGATAPS